MSTEQTNDTEQKFVAAGIETAEQYANSGAIVELDGVHVVNMLGLYNMRRRQVQRGLTAIPTGRMTVQHEIPTFLR